MWSGKHYTVNFSNETVTFRYTTWSQHSLTHQTPWGRQSPWSRKGVQRRWGRGGLGPGPKSKPFMRSFNLGGGGWGGVRTRIQRLVESKFFIKHFDFGGGRKNPDQNSWREGSSDSNLKSKVKKFSMRSFNLEGECRIKFNPVSSVFSPPLLWGKYQFSSS